MRLVIEYIDGEREVYTDIYGIDETSQCWIKFKHMTKIVFDGEVLETEENVTLNKRKVLKYSINSCIEKNV